MDLVVQLVVDLVAEVVAHPVVDGLADAVLALGQLLVDQCADHVLNGEALRAGALGLIECIGRGVDDDHQGCHCIGAVGAAGDHGLSVFQCLVDVTTAVCE